MADDLNLIKISGLQPTNELKPADIIPISQDGQTRSIKGAVLEQNLLNKTDGRYIENSQKGVPNGVATLDADGNLVQGIDESLLVKKSDIGVTVAGLDSEGKIPNEQLKFGSVAESDMDVVSGGEVYKKDEYIKMSLSKGNIALDSNRQKEINDIVGELFIDGLKSSSDLFIRTMDLNVETKKFRVYIYQDGVNLSDVEYIDIDDIYYNKPYKLKFKDKDITGYVVIKEHITYSLSGVNALLDKSKVTDINFSPIILKSFLDLNKDGVLVDFTSVPNNNLRIKELYFTEDYSNYRLRRLYTNNTQIRVFIGLKDGSSTSSVVQLAFDNIDTDIFGKVLTMYHTTELKIVGYIVLEKYNNQVYNWDGTAEFTPKSLDINSSPKIKELLNRSENLLLMSSSTFGFKSQENVLKEFLNYNSRFKVSNCGFGGCRMSWRTADGSNNYDKFSGIDVADALVSKDFSKQIAANTALGNIFKDRLIDLMNIDLSKPTTIFLKYIDNDIVGGAQMGDLWNFTDTLADFDKTTFLGAMNYTVNRLTVAYPHIKWVVFSESWRYKTDKNNQKVPPYAFVNSIDIVGDEYSVKEKENCKRMGLSFMDFLKHGIQNNWNNSTFFVDDTHFNYKGWKLFSDKLKHIYNSFIN